MLFALAATEGEALALHALQISDLHGFLAGQAHDPSYGDLATAQSYVARVRAAQAADGVLATFVGDFCDGTGLSDLTAPKCTLVFQAAAQTGFDFCTLGNHDVGYADSLDFLLREKARLGLALVSANVFAKEGGENVTEMAALAELANGLRVLVLPFTVAGFDEYPSVAVQDAAQVFESHPAMQRLLDELAPKTDVVLLMMHAGHAEEQTARLRRAVRARFGPETPILVQTAHSHELFSAGCEGDANCFVSEAGAFGQNVVHLRHRFAREGGRCRYLGTDKFASDKNSAENFAPRLEVAPEAFDTPAALQLRSQVQSWAAEMGLDKVEGFSKFDYLCDAGDMAAPASVHRLWVDAMVPAIVARPGACQQVAFAHSGDLRAPIHRGAVFFDDTRQLMPFDNTVLVLAGLSRAEAACVAEGLPAFCHTAFDGAPCADLLTNEYECATLQAQLAACGAAPRECAPYETREALNSTADVFRLFANKYMQRDAVLAVAAQPKPVLFLALFAGAVCAAVGASALLLLAHRRRARPSLE